MQRILKLMKQQYLPTLTLYLLINKEEYVEICEDKKTIKVLLTFYSICMFIVNIFYSTNEDSSWFNYIKFRTWECWEFERTFKLGSCKMYVYFNQNLKKLSKLKC